MSGDRFAFGANWAAFLETLDDERIERAEESLSRLLDLGPARERPLRQRTFLDLGCGSGLFSLAAYRLGARVVSVDFDPQCVACTRELFRREVADADGWTIMQGSVLDGEAMEQLGRFDVVYSWGVLHHTGDMRRAVENACDRVSPSGTLAIAIYNDQGRASRRWLAIKRLYHRLPRGLRPVWVGLIAFWYESKFALVRLIRGRNPLPFADWKQKKADRGMSVWHDWVDWVGGLPFEVATPDEVEKLVERDGFRLCRCETVGNGWGCNEFVFRRLQS